jgi:hypothetical protein
MSNLSWATHTLGKKGGKAGRIALFDIFGVAAQRLAI